MDRQDVEKRVVKVVSQVLKVAPGEIRPEANFVFDLGADSMASIALVAAFEREFDVEMDEESALDVQTVGNAVDYIMNCMK